jgi:hypothetical protein
VVAKEIRFRPGSTSEELSIKFAMARRFLGKGQRVVLTVIFRGGDAAAATRANGSRMLLDAAAEIGGLGVVIGEPSQSPATTRSMSLTLWPREAGGSTEHGNQPPDSPSDPPGGVREPRKPPLGTGGASGSQPPSVPDSAS